jgi:predicted enzyme related to lactoylglutathione lyase
MTITAASTIHYVSNMDRALAFYKSAFDLVSTSESPGWSTFRDR